MKKLCVQTKSNLRSLVAKPRRSKISPVVLAAILLLTIFFNAQPVYAHRSGGYSYDPGVETRHEEWMTWLKDSALISELSIPGTHDSMANSSEIANGWLVAQCQSKTLNEQLESGIRAIDIRCMFYYESPKLFDLGIIQSTDDLNKDKFAIYHGPMYQGKNFDDVLKNCRDFLADHPGETILMRVKEEKDAWEFIPETIDRNGETIAIKSEMEPSSTFSQTFERYKSEYPGLIWSPSDYLDVNGTKFVKAPTLGEVRGKIVILDDFSKSDGLSEPYGLRWENNNWEKDNIIMSVQDEYNPEKLYDKWENVKSHITNSNTNIYENREKIYINHLSANNPGAAGYDSQGYLPPLVPYFVASGHMFSETDSSRLNTGIHAEGKSNLYPDFPRIKETWSFGDFFDYTATFIYYEGINELVLNYLIGIDRTGIMMIDFPGPDLINSIISKNLQLTEFIKISSYNTEWTNQDITVYARAKYGLPLNRTSYTFSENGSFTFYTSFSVPNPLGGEFVIAYSRPVTITNIDKVAPVITVTEPAENATYILGEPAYANWDAADYESGIATSNATLENGEALDTSSVGTKTFIVTATDAAGNTSTKTITYNVTYGFSGVMRPVKGDGTDTFKPGETIPIKFRLTDTNDQYITNSVAEIYYSKVIDGDAGYETEAVSTRSADQGNVCAYDADDNQYLYNLSTKGWDPGTYQVTIKLDDGTSHNIEISSKTK